MADTSYTNGRAVKIRLEDLTKQYQTEQQGYLPVFSTLNVDIMDQEFVSIIGPSGCGKTTLLSMIAGLIQPSSGRILVDGQAIKGPGRDRGVVFQQDAIFPWRTVQDNIEYGLELRGVSKSERRRAVEQFISLVNLDRFVNFYPKELSGGMKKRVALAAVFANDPEVLLMDEPFGSLDYPSKLELQHALLGIWERATKTTVFITHDLEEAIFLSDRVLAMADHSFAHTVQVPFSRPRSDELRTAAEFQDLKRDLWRYLR